MTKRGLQGIAVGIFIATAIIAYMYFFQAIEVESNEDEIEIPEFELSSAEMMEILAEQGFVVLEEDEYESLLKAKENEEAIEEVVEPLVYSGTVIVKPGMNSTEVAEQLVELNIIEDSQAFIDFLANQNLTKRIEVGEFELNSGLSFLEIAEIITK